MRVVTLPQVCVLQRANERLVFKIKHIRCAIRQAVGVRGRRQAGAEVLVMAGPGIEGLRIEQAGQPRRSKACAVSKC